ncbi:MAG: hypothetical protein ABI406_06995 [Ktedonobacteraceae bacterium]
MRNRNPLRAATGGIFLIGMAIAFAISSQFGGHWFLPILFITLACTSLIGSLNFNRRGVYSGSYGFVWLAVLALFFITGSWIWFLVGAGLSAILGSLWRPMIGGAYGRQGDQQPYYQPTYQQPPTNQPYEQGYQPPAQQPPAAYQEGNQQYPYPQPQEPQYEQPQVQYPQEMPPPQQG